MCLNRLEWVIKTWVWRSLIFSYSVHSFIILNSGQYNKPFTIVNDNSKVVSMLETSLNDNARVIIYNRHMFIVQATGPNVIQLFTAVSYTFS